MVIILNIGRFFPLEDSGYSYFLNRVITEWVRQHPQCRFHFFIDKERMPDKLPSANNLSFFTYEIKGTLFRHWRIKNKLADLVKKTNAQALISFDSSVFHFRQPAQCLVLLSEKSANSFRKKDAEQVKKIVVLSRDIKERLVGKSISQEKIAIVYGAAKETISPRTEEKKAAVKEKYTDGQEYFIYKGEIAPANNIIQLLKAFSVFKKRQKSSMKLVITGQMRWNKEDFEKLVSTYKYRDDLVIASQIPEDDQLTLLGSAYALIYPPTEETTVLFAMDAMKYGVPVIATETLSLKEMAGAAALHFNASDVSDIASKMMLIYKDEALRSRLVKEGLETINNYTWPQTAAAIWECIEA